MAGATADQKADAEAKAAAEAEAAKAAEEAKAAEAKTAEEAKSTEAAKDAEADKPADTAKQSTKVTLVVTGAAVVLRTKSGDERYLYKGAPIVGDEFDADSIKHAKSVGLIGKK